jgi:hypothetical protein
LLEWRFSKQQLIKAVHEIATYFFSNPQNLTARIKPIVISLQPKLIAGLASFKKQGDIILAG